MKIYKLLGKVGKSRANANRKRRLKLESENEVKDLKQRRTSEKFR